MVLSTRDFGEQKDEKARIRAIDGFYTRRCTLSEAVDDLPDFYVKHQPPKEVNTESVFIIRLLFGIPFFSFLFLVTIALLGVILILIHYNA